MLVFELILDIVSVLGIKFAIHSIWSKIGILYLFLSYYMFLLGFNNYPQIFFAIVGMFVFK